MEFLLLYIYILHFNSVVDSFGSLVFVDLLHYWSSLSR